MPFNLFKVLRAWVWFQYGRFCKDLSIKVAIKRIPDRQIEIEIGMIRMKIANALLKERDRAYEYGRWILNDLS